MNSAEAHSDFMKIISFDHPADAIDYCQSLSAARREQLEIYIAINGEIARKEQRRNLIWFGAFVFVGIALYVGFVR